MTLLIIYILMSFWILVHAYMHVSDNLKHERKKQKDNSLVFYAEKTHLIWKYITKKCDETGTVWTASSHIITAVIGSGVLSLPWGIAQLGWIAGPTVMLSFSLVTIYSSSLLVQCYRSEHPNSGKRNYTYTDAVRSILGNTCFQKYSFHK